MDNTFLNADRLAGVFYFGYIDLLSIECFDERLYVKIVDLRLINHCNFLIITQ